MRTPFLPSLVLLLGLAAPVAAQYETAAPKAGSAPSLKKALKEGRVVIGATITVPNVDTAVAAANAGFDFLWVEMEHGPISLQSLHEMVLATRGAAAVPLARVPFNERWLAKQVLDMGALGVIFPFTTTRELAEQAVAACRYPPAGVRGFGPGLAAGRYGLTSSEYVAFADENVLVVVIIEEKAAVANVDAIASVPGVDVVFIGVNDLSFSMGKRGSRDAEVEEAIAKVLAAARKHGVTPGIVAGGADDINKRIAQGFRFFQTGSELSLIRNGAQQLLSQVKREAPATGSAR